MARRGSAAGGITKSAPTHQSKCLAAATGWGPIPFSSIEKSHRRRPGCPGLILRSRIPPCGPGRPRSGHQTPSRRSKGEHCPLPRNDRQPSQPSPFSLRHDAHSGKSRRPATRHCPHRRGMAAIRARRLEDPSSDQRHRGADPGSVCSYFGRPRQGLSPTQ